jgi:hypothetical protein
MSGRNLESPQRSVEELFLRVFRWYCKSADLTFDEFLVCLADRMDVSDRTNLRFDVFVDDDTQRKGEEALVELARRLPYKGRQIRRWSDAPGRAVDWSQTWLSREMGRCERFCNLERVLVPDKATRCALAGLAYRWESVLDTVTSTEDRQKRLLALQDARRYLSSEVAVWSQGVSRRLHHVDGARATAIDAAIRLWEGNGRKGAALANFVGDWLRKDHQAHLRANNSNTLLEWTAALWVARAASKLGWKWEAASVLMSGSGKYSDLHMKKGKWRFRVSKGQPRSPGDEPISGADRVDLVTEARRTAGLNARGQEPDIVMTFWHSEHPDNHVTYLGDAKRNETKDGQGYLTASVMRAGAYLYAFGEWLHCRPRFTLFMWQGITTGREKASEEVVQPELASLIQKCRKESECPDILCIHSGMIGESGENLKDWFDHLCCQAQKRLEGCETATTGMVPRESSII